MFFGSIPAVITPFKNHEVDYESLSVILNHLIQNGSNGLVPCGTTGESPTLSHEEHKKIIEETIRISDKRIPIIAGTGSNNTAEAIDFTKHAESNGADAALVVTPYYNKPTQQGLFAHFEKIAKSVKIPIIIYNIPGRSVVDMSIETMIKLSKIDNIVGVKDATNDLFRPLLTIANMKSDFCFLSGEDGTALAFLAQGGHGCISVTANIAPKLCSELQKAWREKDIQKAQEFNLKLAKLHNSLFVESSPGPVKYAASLIGLCNSETRLPLVEITEKTKNEVFNCLKDLSLI
ncbi:MAG: 4-hydroxy-tetrahydrodipicolinate synthase [Pelagibacteraceae bacterium]|jgi:4-hydroxy-tetrahydrodipicolinate synthase|nr:4-hydroxy-tetrahydrodipicolinate synthase [Pelagibacteraceae bacterium]MBT3902896.1 4-hydroxy-tetrahydrodipicolinate synthase [Pelagibacteraceae bacterium]MBT4645187.1 4-hydroxy-tetrahydrodipicolinate synthase [Pelagibacteraceae bacterium]MBT4952117.1 4-hydroxy-tetrahydrodipicolinate synthase [Pelagibacteraceae bacterium]MBT5213414.1 4-hydroxy-tetrahydrodipicolinate synthase [Pelagibacteraceae bacterium]